MPTALLRSCTEVGCPELVEAGRCHAHQREVDRHRGSPSARGYTRRWERFRAWFLQRLNGLAIQGIGVGAICGGRLPGAPLTTHSRCLAEGRENAVRLQVDHIVPHRGDERLLYDQLNCQVLCLECHSAKTATEESFNR